MKDLYILRYEVVRFGYGTCGHSSHVETIDSDNVCVSTDLCRLRIDMSRVLGKVLNWFSDTINGKSVLYQSATDNCLVVRYSPCSASDYAVYEVRVIISDIKRI